MLRHYHRFSDEVSSNFVYILFFDFPRQISEGIVHPKVLFEAGFEN